MDKVNITGDIIVNAIATKLNSTFNNPSKIYNIYSNQVVGEMQEPCFFIHQLEVIRVKVRRNLWTYRFIMDIRYHSNVEISSLYGDLDAMSIKLLDAVENVYIQEKPVKIEEDTMSTEKQNNVLHVFVNYLLYATEDVANIYMQNLDLKEEI